MVKRRISNREARETANIRMSRLMDMATEEASSGNVDRSRRYVKLARSIGMRTNTRMLKDRLYCRDCFVALVPGNNCRVRLREHRVVVHCLVCDSIRRFPYINEQRGHGYAKNDEKKRS